MILPSPATVRGFPILGAYYRRTVRACALISSSEIIGPAGCHHSRRWHVAASAPSGQEPDVPQASDRTLELCAPLNYSNPITIKADLSTHGTSEQRWRFTGHIPGRVDTRRGEPQSDQQTDPRRTARSPLLPLRIQSPLPVGWAKHGQLPVRSLRHPRRDMRWLPRRPRSISSSRPWRRCLPTSVSRCERGRPVTRAQPLQRAAAGRGEGEVQPAADPADRRHSQLRPLLFSTRWDYRAPISRQQLVRITTGSTAPPIEADTRPP